jgi:hypothetical protein
MMIYYKLPAYNTNLEHTFKVLDRDMKRHDTCWQHNIRIEERDSAHLKRA